MDELRQAIGELAEREHNHEFWSDANRTHTREYRDCTDPFCRQYRILALTDVDLGIAKSDKWPAFSE